MELGDRIRAARVEGCRLALRDFLDQAVELGGRRLIEARLLLQPQETDRLQQTQRADPVDVGGIFGCLEADRDVALRAEV